MKPKILFITTNNLSTNPRLLKEIKLASENGFIVSFIGFKLGSWADKTDENHLETFQCFKKVYLSAIRKPFFNWLISTIIWKASNLLCKWFKYNIRLNAFAHNKRTWQIYRYLQQENSKFDLIVSHNLGALYPAYQFTKKNRIPFAFDIEDYHPGENCAPDEKKRREFLMKKLLPKALFITYASPLIGEYSKNLIENITKSINEKSTFHLSKEHFILINNCFSQNEFQFKATQSDKIRFVWFSQNISAGRGLELVVPALANYNSQIELTLIGNLYQSFYDDFLSKYISFIKIEEPLTQKKLNQKLSEFDVGLAIELDVADFNRQICLTNKIFSYAQSGLYILATNTAAQNQFIAEHDELGITCGQSIAEMVYQIDKIVKNIAGISNQKHNRFEYAQKLAWENESSKLLKLWGRDIDRGKN